MSPVGNHWPKWSNDSWNQGEEVGHLNFEETHFKNEECNKEDRNKSKKKSTKQKKVQKPLEESARMF